MSKKKPVREDDRIANAGAWQGTEPEEGTRRAVVRAALTDSLGADLGVVKSPLEVADAIELALLEHTEENGAPSVEGGEAWLFEVFEASDPHEDESEWCWRLNAGNGDIVVQTGGYDTRKDAEAAIEEVKAHASRAGFPVGG